MTKVVSKKIRNSARGEDCALRIPNVCFNDTDTVILAHVKSKYKGWGMKSLDIHGMYCCFNCHAHYDLGNKIDPQWILDAMIETQYKLIEKGLICIPSSK